MDWILTPSEDQSEAGGRVKKGNLFQSNKCFRFVFTTIPLLKGSEVLTGSDSIIFVGGKRILNIKFKLLVILSFLTGQTDKPFIKKITNLEFLF